MSRATVIPKRAYQVTAALRQVMAHRLSGLQVAPAVEAEAGQDASNSRFWHPALGGNPAIDATLLVKRDHL